MATKQTLPTIERLTEQLSGQAQAQGLEPHLILPPAAATVMLLGSGDLYTPILEGLAASADPVGLLGQLFTAQAAYLPYLAGQLDPLTSIMTGRRIPTVSTVRSEACSTSWPVPIFTSYSKPQQSPATYSATYPR